MFPEWIGWRGLYQPSAPFAITEQCTSMLKLMQWNDMNANTSYWGFNKQPLYSLFKKGLSILIISCTQSCSNAKRPCICFVLVKSMCFIVHFNGISNDKMTN